MLNETSITSIITNNLNSLETRVLCVFLYLVIFVLVWICGASFGFAANDLPNEDLSENVPGSEAIDSHNINEIDGNVINLCIEV